MSYLAENNHSGGFQALELEVGTFLDIPVGTFSDPGRFLQEFDLVRKSPSYTPGSHKIVQWSKTKSKVDSQSSQIKPNAFC